MKGDTNDLGYRIGAWIAGILIALVAAGIAVGGYVFGRFSR